MPKHIIMDDLQTESYLLMQKLVEEAWAICYQHMAEFIRAGAVFDQFKERLQDH
jgi:hypothetical protein